MNIESIRANFEALIEVAIQYTAAPYTALTLWFLLHKPRGGRGRRRWILAAWLRGF